MKKHQKQKPNHSINRPINHRPMETYGLIKDDRLNTSCVCVCVCVSNYIAHVSQMSINCKVWFEQSKNTRFGFVVARICSFPFEFSWSESRFFFRRIVFHENSTSGRLKMAITKLIWLIDINMPFVFLAEETAKMFQFESSFRKKQI